MQSLLQGNVEGVGHEGDEDAGFNAVSVLVIDRSERQVSLQILECVFDVANLEVRRLDEDKHCCIPDSAHSSWFLLTERRKPEN